MNPRCELSPPPARFEFDLDPYISAEEAVRQGVATLQERTYIRLMQKRHREQDDAENRRYLRRYRSRERSFLEIAFARYYRARDACERHRPSGHAPKEAHNARARGSRRATSRSTGNSGDSGDKPPGESDPPDLDAAALVAAVRRELRSPSQWWLDRYQRSWARPGQLRLEVDS
jgi:hypothetical protein